jgi:hypothetical protein
MNTKAKTNKYGNITYLQLLENVYVKGELQQKKLASMVSLTSQKLILAISEWNFMATLKPYAKRL